MPMRPYTLIRAKRSTISLTVKPTGEVVVHAPHIMPTYFINKFLEEKSDWINKKIAEVQKRAPAPKREYAEGEEFLYLGDVYTLKFTIGTDIEIKPPHLLYPKALQFRIQKELNSWYMRLAKEVITKRVEHHAHSMKAHYTSLLFSDTKSKWGSCGPDNALQFSWKLIMTPLVVVDYVVIHELAHTFEKNHGDKFWKIVATETPAYKTHRRWLQANSGQMVV